MKTPKSPRRLPLKAGDLCYFLKNDRRYRCVVASSLMIPRRRGEPDLVPVIRPRNTRKATPNIDRSQPAEEKIRWIDRKQLRKLPSPTPKTIELEPQKATQDAAVGPSEAPAPLSVPSE